MLYMRLRGAVMDPSSGGADWQKSSRFTVEQMRRMMPSTRPRGTGADEYAGKRTIQEALALLLDINALRRIEGGGSQVPVYDFPMYPSEAHQGLLWGGDVAKEVREQTKGRKPGRPAKRPDPITEENPCALPHPLRSTAPVNVNPCGTPHGGCGRAHGVEALTCADGASKKLFKKNPLPPQEKTEDEEDSAFGDKPGTTVAEVTQMPARRGIKTASEKITEKLSDIAGVTIQGSEREAVRQAVYDLLAGQWTEAGILSLLSGTDWSNINTPVRFVRSRVEGAVGTAPARTREERAGDTLESLKARRTAQEAAIAACGGCGDYGRTTRAWHGHDDEDLKNRIWALENPKEAAQIAALNGQSHQAMA